MHVTFDGEQKMMVLSQHRTSLIIFEKNLKDSKRQVVLQSVDFDYIFDRIHADHPEAHILYLAYSSVTTCAYGCAQIAMENRDYITAIDTKLYSIGQGQVLVRMAELLREHPEWGIDEAVNAANDLIARGHMSFIPKTLAFLVAGGRVSNAKALLAGCITLASMY